MPVTISDERRLVTVLFADLVGFTGRAEQSDPEALRTLQRTYFAAVSAEVERYGGTLEKFIGDAAMAIFGAPQAHDDDAERALRTALRIREAVAAMEGGLEVRIGVNTGEVVGGMGAGPQAGDYTVSGDAVNVAARRGRSAPTPSPSRRAKSWRSGDAASRSRPGALSASCRTARARAAARRSWSVGHGSSTPLPPRSTRRAPAVG